MEVEDYGSNNLLLKQVADHGNSPVGRRRSCQHALLATNSVKRGKCTPVVMGDERHSGKDPLVAAHGLNSLCLPFPEPRVSMKIIASVVRLCIVRTHSIESIHGCS